MSNIYLKVTIETFSKLQFSEFKTICYKVRYHWILKFVVATLKSEVWKQNCVLLFYCFNFDRNYEVLKPKNSFILLNKYINFNKSKRNRKWKIPHTVLEGQTWCISSYKNHKLKAKLWWVGACERKKRAFFVTFILSKREFI